MSSHGLLVLNVSDPENPFEVAFFNDGEYTYDIFVEGNYIYVANAADGLEIIYDGDFHAANNIVTLFHNHIPSFLKVLKDLSNDKSKN